MILEIIISVVVGFLLLFSIYVARKRGKEIVDLKIELKSKSLTSEELVSKLSSAISEKSQMARELVDMKMSIDRISCNYEDRLTKLDATYKKELGARKSSEVRLGKIGESLAPFLNGWPWDPNNFRFIGNPIDGIQFTDDEIMFIEIKTGKARLTDSQKYIKDLISKKKVSFVTFRIGEEGNSLKIEGADNG